MRREPASPCESSWRDEVRRFLLGRLVRDTATTSIDRQRADVLPTARIAHWWLFEGKRYRPLDGPLHQHFVQLERELQRLLGTYHPALMISDRPEPGVDWARTVALGPRVGRSEFVVQASRTGLGEEERAALVGWARWLEDEWERYCMRVTLPSQPALARFVRALGGAPSPYTVPALRRWMHVTRRSRWPLLRDIVAETLRVFLEPQELERLPLPADRAQLFELLVLTRAACALVGLPDSIRWLDHEAGNNTVHVGNVRLRVQRHLGRERVLQSGVYEASLTEALQAFHVKVPSIADIVIDFPQSTRSRLRGIIIEAKSGTAEYADTVEQLTAYRAAIPREHEEQHLLIWGVTEHGGPLMEEQSAWLRTQLEIGKGDVWAFSSAEDIAKVLTVIFDHPLIATA